MRIRALAIVCVVTVIALASSTDTVLSAQRGKQEFPESVTGKEIKIPPSPPGGDLKTVLFNWANHMGMIRGTEQIDAIVTYEYYGTGTIAVGGQPCKLTKYRVSVNHQDLGMREEIACTLPNGQQHTDNQVVAGQFAWNEVGGVGAGLVPGKGQAVPAKEVLAERLIRLWSNPYGAVKAATRGGANTKATVLNGRNVLTYPIPGVDGAIATATLTGGKGFDPCAANCAERIEVRHGTTVTEFTYSNYGDYNDEQEKLDAYFPRRIVEKQGTTTLRDITLTSANISNLYVVVPVPPNVRKAGN